MNLIVGLGNPGKKYIENRHNIGYQVVDEYAKFRGISWRYSQDWTAYYAKTDDIVLLKPATFMNRSGVSVSGTANFYKINKKDILVIHDELDLPFGKIRLTFDSLSAGHKGINSVIESLGGNEFSRMRIGIDKPKRKGEVESYVLKDFGKNEKTKLNKIISESRRALEEYINQGIDAAMNKFN